MRTSIIVQLQVEGLHNWPEVNIESVDFLAYKHRHIFHIKAQRQVQHDDRDIEIIKFKRSILKSLKDRYWSLERGCHDFGSKSCEMIAAELVLFFNLDSCEVLEDGENGAVVTK